MLEVAKDYNKKSKNNEYEELEKKLYALRTISPQRSIKKLAISLIVIISIVAICMFLPWQQSIEGSGIVTAFSPQDRPQEVHTAIPGRIKEWKVQEGQKVKKNDTLVVLTEIKDDYFDPEFLKRLEEQLEAKKNVINAKQNKIEALENQLSALQSGLSFKLSQAQNKYEQAKNKLKAEQADFDAERNNFIYYQRQSKSYDSLYFAKPVALISQTEWEKRRQMLQEAQAKVTMKENKVAVAQNELVNARIELNSVEAEYRDKIAKSMSDKSATQGDLADSQAELSKLKNKYANMVIRNNQYYILAPQDGFVVKALKSGVGETVKDTDPICTIMPSTPSLAVELYVRAMDLPLLSVGRHVRMEFDGFPALQVTGWPRVAVGTFGGTIAVIDKTDSENGKFRVLVIPTKEEPWPKELSVGSGVYGWAMLDTVPVWYETWRQLNGFPPSLYEEKPKSGKNKDKDGKKGKKSDQKIKVKVKK
jgi:multidrug resistance efflux pump